MKITNEISKKISFYSLLIWCGLPLLITGINPIIKQTATVYFFIFLIVIGILGIINGVIYFKNNKKEILNSKNTTKLPFIILFTFLFFTFVSCILADNKVLSFIGTEYRHEGFLTYLCYAGFFIDALVISNDKNLIYRLFRMLVISSGVLGILVLIGDSIFITNSNTWEPSIYAAIFSNENHFAYYLTISIMCSFFLGIYKNKIYGLVFILLSYILIKNDTFGSYLAVVITLAIFLIYYLIKKEKRIFVILLCIIFIGLSLLSSNVTENFKQTSGEVTKIIENHDNLEETIVEEELLENHSTLLICAGNSRVDLWIKGVRLSNKKPLFGYGLENLKEPYKKVVMCDATDRPHNTFIQILMTNGYIGLVLWISFIGMFFYKGIKKIKKLDKYLIMTFGMIIAYMASSFFGNSMYYTTPYYIIMLGIASSVFLQNKKSTK